MTAITWDPAAKNAYIVLSGGNLTAAGDTTQAFVEAVKATLYSAAGKQYFEVTVGGSNNDAGTRNIGIGLSTAALTNGTYVGSTDSISYQDNAVKRKDTTGVGYGASWASGDIISVVWDADGGDLSFWKNGADQGVAYSGITGNYTPMVSVMGNVNQTMTVNFGATLFAYTPPPGYSGWDSPPPTPGVGTATLIALQGVGYRIAAGASTMEQFTATGGYHGLGAGVLEYFVVEGSGGTKAGAGALEAMTGSATGYQAARGDATLEALTAAATGYDSEIWTFAGTAPAPKLSSYILTGEAITFAGTAPMSLLEIGCKDIVLTAPVPTLSATLLPGRILTVAVKAPKPTLAAVNFNPAIITVEGLVRAPILTATLLAGQIGTASLILRPPYLTATGLTGTVSTILASAVTPILVAAGYPAFTITFAGSAPPPRLDSVLGFALSENYRTWVLNTRKGALTSYDNFNFNSFAAFNGQVIAAGSSGIVVLGTQDLDNATTITAKVRSGRDSFGSSYHKRVPRMYVGHNATGDLLVRMITTEGGERTYRLAWNHGVGIRQARVPIGKGPRSRYWQWEIENEAGADFGIDNVMLYPTKLHRRVM